MKRNTKRFLSLFVSVPMTLNLMATPVSAAAPDATANPVVTEQETTITMMPETSHSNCAVAVHIKRNSTRHWRTSRD